MAKTIIHNEEAKQKLKAGIDAVANTVRATLGARGRNVMLDVPVGCPTVTNDGVSIARDIELKDPFENMGAKMVKEAASRTNDLAGDGTTTATVLTQALVHEGLKHASMGHSPLSIRRGMEKARDNIIAYLSGRAIEVTGDMAKQIAAISAEDPELGDKIAQLIERVGKDGVITVDESHSFEISTDVVEGMQLDSGYVSPYMVTNEERMEAEYKEVPIMITDQKVSSVKDVAPLIESLAATGHKQLVIIADDIEGEALSTFVVNTLRGTFSVLGIKAPGFGDNKRETLQDVAVLTGATLISNEAGIKLSESETSHLGYAGRIVATRTDTTITDGKGEEDAVAERVATIKTELEKSESAYEAEKLNERVAKLTGGIGVVRVGASTESEMKYLKLKVEDAVAATKAAIDEGIVPGGGTSLAFASEMVLPPEELTDEELIGYKIVCNALTAPLKRIAENSGLMAGDVALQNVLEGEWSSKCPGFNALTGEIEEDMIAAGIIDPFKVERAAIEFAVSTAGITLTTESLVADEIEDGGKEK